LEESVVNAMYHRSYEIREPVEIRVHPDRIEILRENRDSQKKYRNFPCCNKTRGENDECTNLAL